MSKVLVVDHNPKRGDYIKTILNVKGHQTRLVTPNSWASQYVNQSWPDVVFLAGSKAEEGSFRVTYSGPNDSSSSKFFLQLANRVARQVWPESGW